MSLTPVSSHPHFPHGISRRLALACLACILTTDPIARAASVIDQIGALATAASYDFSTLPEPSVSQIFPDFPDSSSAALENFTVTSSQLNVTEVGVVFRALGGFEDFSNLDGFLLNIFSDVSLAGTSLQGNVASLTINAGSNLSITEIVDTSGFHSYGLLRFTLDLDLPEPGEYWIGVSPVSNAETLGQFMLLASPVAGLGVPDARLANPGNGFGVGTLSLTDNHHAVSVTAVPEPGAALLLLASGLPFIFLRRRNPRFSS